MKNRAKGERDSTSSFDDGANSTPYLHKLQYVLDIDSVEKGFVAQGIAWQLKIEFFSF